MKTLTLLFTLLLAIGAGAQNKYATFELGPGATFANVQTINDSGQVLGWWPGSGKDFVISPGNVWTKNIATYGGGVLTMNNSATIIGTLYPSNQVFYKLWEQPVVELGSANQITANAINTAGYIAGTTLEYGPTQLYLEDPNVSFVHVPFPHDKYPNDWVKIDDDFGSGSSLNNLNQVVGSWENYSTPWSGFFYDSNSKQLNTAFNMPGAVYTYPVSINDNQEVVGDWLDSNGVYHGFYWNATAGFSDIDVSGDTAMFLAGINNQSVILGAWQDANTPPKYHFVTIVNGQTTASIKVPGSKYTGGTAINNVGQVVGEYETQAGVIRGFIYTPSK